jgi:hypothetical protein
MNSLRHIAIPLIALLALAGCSSTQVVSRQSDMGNERIPRPNRILIYDFGSTSDDIPDDSALAGEVSDPEMPPSDKDLEAARKLGVEVSTDLAKEIQAMGLPGLRAADQPPPQPGDIVIRGYFLSVDQGSRTERMLIGFGEGAADLRTFVEGYLMTDQGLRRLGSGEINSGAKGGTPGLLVPLAVTIATANPIGIAVGGAVKVAGEASGSSTIKGSGKRTAELIAKELRKKFIEQGWIAD